MEDDVQGGCQMMVGLGHRLLQTITARDVAWHFRIAMGWFAALPWPVVRVWFGLAWVAAGSNKRMDGHLYCNIS